MAKSDEFLKLIEKFLAKKELNFLDQNQLDLTNQSVKKWKKNAIKAIDFLEKFNLDFCLIKIHDLPFARMGDVDFLVEDGTKLEDFYLKLKDRGFVFHHIPFNDKLKLTAIDPKSKFEMDFYPDAKWSELRYANKGFISSSKRITVKHGIKIFSPKPEHEIYITATHGYSHGRLNLMEVISTCKTILDEKSDINEIVSLSEKFHMQNGVYVLLSSVNSIFSLLNYEVIDDSVMKKLSLITHPIITKKFNKSNFDIFPIQFSVKELFAVSMSRIGANNLDKSISVFDEIANFVLHNRLINKIYNLSPEYNHKSE